MNRAANLPEPKAKRVLFADDVYPSAPEPTQITRSNNQKYLPIIYEFLDEEIRAKKNAEARQAHKKMEDEYEEQLIAHFGRLCQGTKCPPAMVQGETDSMYMKRACMLMEKQLRK